MKFTEKIAIGWKGSPGARLCFASFALSMLRFFYLWDVPHSLALAWLDLFIIPIMGIFLICGWVLVYRQMVRSRARKKHVERSSGIIDHWTEEICGLSLELCEAVERDAPTEEIEAINGRIDEAHKRREREAAILRKQS